MTRAEKKVREFKGNERLAMEAGDLLAVLAWSYYIKGFEAGLAEAKKSAQERNENGEWVDAK